jgi:hypothetical protein
MQDNMFGHIFCSIMSPAGHGSEVEFRSTQFLVGFVLLDLVFCEMF